MANLSAVSLGLDTLHLDAAEVCLRLICAMVVGLAIGIEREHTHRPAGMRTHILVALGSCVVMIVGQMIFMQYQAFGAAPDPARLGAQVVSGVSFLGAGTIMREGVNVKGLTTAASLWTVACLGLAAGAGYYIVAIVGMLLVFITLTVFEVFQRKLFTSHTPQIDFSIESTQIAPAMQAIATHAKAAGMKINRTRMKQLPGSTYRVIVNVSVNSSHVEKRVLRFCKEMISEPSVIAVEQLESTDSREKQMT